MNNKNDSVESLGQQSPSQPMMQAGAVRMDADQPKQESNPKLRDKTGRQGNDTAVTDSAYNSAYKSRTESQIRARDSQHLSNQTQSLDPELRTKTGRQQGASTTDSAYRSNTESQLFSQDPSSDLHFNPGSAQNPMAISDCQQQQQQREGSLLAARADGQLESGEETLHEQSPDSSNLAPNTDVAGGQYMCVDPAATERLSSHSSPSASLTDSSESGSSNGAFADTERRSNSDSNSESDSGLQRQFLLPTNNRDQVRLIRRIEDQEHLRSAVVNHPSGQAEGPAGVGPRVSTAPDIVGVEYSNSLLYCCDETA